MALPRISNITRQLDHEIQIIFDAVEAVLAPGGGGALGDPGGNGIVVRTASGVTTSRSLVQPSAGITIANANGVSGNPTLALADDLLAVEGISGTGFVRRTAINTWSASALVSGDLPGSFSGFANPTASVGLTAVNGSATTAMRSDGAPPIDQTIAPTWTGLHTHKIVDTVNNANSDILILAHDPSNTPAIGMGVGLLFKMKSSTTLDRDAARISAVWEQPADVSRGAGLSFYTVTAAGALTERMRVSDATSYLVMTEFRIGSATNQGGVGNASRLYIYGGSNGCNVDIQADGTSAAKDSARIEVEASDYSTTLNSANLEYYGPTAIGNILGTANQNMGALRFMGGTRGVIENLVNAPIQFGINNVEKMRLNSTGLNVGGNTTPVGLFSVGNASQFQVTSTGTAGFQGTTPTANTAMLVTRTGVAALFATTGQGLDISLTGSDDLIDFGTIRAINLATTWSGTGSTFHQTLSPVNVFATHSGTGRLDSALAYQATIGNSGGGILQAPVAYYGAIQNTGASVMGQGAVFQAEWVQIGTSSNSTFAALFQGRFRNLSGTPTALAVFGLYLTGWSKVGGSTVTTSAGIEIDSSIDIGTTRWAIHSTSTSASLFNGDVSVINTTTSSVLKSQSTVAGSGGFVIASNDGNLTANMIMYGSGGTGASFVTLPNAATFYTSAIGGTNLAAAHASGEIRFYTGGFNPTTNLRWKMSSAGHFLAGTDNTYDIGASGATRPRDIFIGRDLLVSGLLKAGTSPITVTTTAGYLKVSAIDTTGITGYALLKANPSSLPPSIGASNLFDDGTTVTIGNILLSPLMVMDYSAGTGQFGGITGDGLRFSLGDTAIGDWVGAGNGTQVFVQDGLSRVVLNAVGQTLTWNGARLVAGNWGREIGDVAIPFSSVYIGSNANSVQLTGTATGARVATLPDATTKLPIASQFLTFTGMTAARTLTLYDANFTVARINDINTFVNNQTFSTSITTPSILATADLTIAPTGNVIFNTTGKQISPQTNYDQNLGALNKKYLTLYAAELWVETLVAQNTIATIGGRVLIGPTTVLTSDLTNVATSIVVKHNQMISGDRVYMEANGQVEFMAITSGPSGTGPYTYTVTRNLDGTGANSWSAGDAVFNTGQTGNGFIDLYSIRSINSRSADFTVDTGTDVFTATAHGFVDTQPVTVNSTVALPAPLQSNVVYFVRDSTANTFKLALNSGGTAIDITSVGSGVHTMFAGSQIGPTVVGNVRNSATYNDWSEHWAIGNLNGLYGYSANTPGVGIGEYAASKTHITIDSTNGFRIFNGTATVIAQWDTSGVITIGQVAASKANTIISAGALSIRLNTTVLFNVDTSGNVTVGETGAGKSNTFISAGALSIRLNTTALFNVDTSGNVRIGTNTAAASTINVFISNASQTYNSEAGFVAGDLLIGDNTVGNFSNIKITAGAIKLRRGVTDRIAMTSAGVMTINDSSGVAKITLDASAGMTLDGKLQMLGASSAIAIGSTPPTSATAGTGIWLDRTGLYALSGGASNVKIDSSGITVNAGSITTAALRVGNFDNLAEDHSFEHSTVSATTWTLGTNWTIKTAGGRTGNNYMDLLINPGGSNSYSMNGYFVECKPGDIFYGECWVAGTGAGAGDVVIGWYDASKALLSYTNGSGGAAGGFNVYTKSTVIGTAPASAVYARVGGVVYSGGVAGWAFDDFYFRFGAVAGWSMDVNSITSTGVTIKSGSTAYIAFGTTPPTGPINSSGVYIDKTGFFGTLSSKQTVALTSADAVFKLGTDLTNVGGGGTGPGTSFLLNGSAGNITHNSETIATGDLLIGDNSSSKANIHWKKSAGQLEFRGGTSVQAYVDTDGTITAGGGVVNINMKGITLAAGSYAGGGTNTEPSTIKWNSGSTVLTEAWTQVATVDSYFFHVHTGTASNSIVQFTWVAQDSTLARKTGFTIESAAAGARANFYSVGTFVGVGVNIQAAPTKILDVRGDGLFKHNDTAVSAVTDILTITHNATGSIALGVGTGLLFNITSNNTADRNAARITALWTTLTDASRTAVLTIQTVTNAAALTEVARFGQGLQMGAPTGGDKGAGTANFAADIYKNNTAYTNPDYVLEHWATGQIIKYADKPGAAEYRGLMPIPALKEFVMNNYHLPRFGQYARHGLFSGGDSLLACLEEAYAYIIELEDRLTKLEAKAA